ncbi:BatD family protein [bacterium]|nr:BatD family protein [bacterium]
MRICGRHHLFLCAVAFALCCAAEAAAADVEFTASVDRTDIQVGSTVQLTISVNSKSGQDDVSPTMPDFGGLQVVGGPSNQSQMTIVNNVMSATTSVVYQLRAPRVGTFTIGPSRLDYGGKSYETKPIQVKVSMQQPPSLPDDLKNESILPARSDNDDVNRQLDGRLFLRAQVSDRNPFVSEPVLITYSIYWERVPINGLQLPQQPIHVSGGLVEDKFRAKNIQPKTEVHGGRTYQVAPIYQFMLTPTTAGEAVIDSYAAVAQLPVQRRSNPRDPFSAFDSPFFGSPGLQVEVPAAPIKLDVRPLPTQGQPAGFNGTVGNFTLKASVDRASIKQDELLTLELTLSGRGAVDLAGPPQFPDNPNFELVDKTQELVKPQPKDYIGGTKRFQFSLRPKKFGRLEVPAIEYPIFNADQESYKVLKTDPIRVQVAEVAGASVQVAAGDKITPRSTGAVPLNFIEPVDAIRSGRAQPLFESPLLWVLQIAGLGVFLFSWRRDWRKARLDPAAVRRGGAWRAFEKRLRAIQAQISSGKQAEAAGAFEHAVRSLIADHFNTSAEGLTRDEIAQLLAGSNLSREQIGKLLQRLDACSCASYAPTAEPVDIAAWSNETRAMLKEGLHA